MICNNILEAMGNTPIIRLNHIADPDGAEILVKFEGLNVGGSIKTRTAFNMIEDAKAGKFDLILTKEVSRFARNTVDTLHYTRDLKRIGVGVMFMNSFSFANTENTLETLHTQDFVEWQQLCEEEKENTCFRCWRSGCSCGCCCTCYSRFQRVHPQRKVQRRSCSLRGRQAA